MLHKHPHNEGRSKSEKTHHARSFGHRGLSGSVFTSSSTSTSSSSTSSSSCSSSDGEEPHRPYTVPSASAVPTTCHHIASENNGMSKQIQPPAAVGDNGSNVYAVYAINGKPSDEGSHLSVPSWIPPHSVCNGPACLRLLKMQRYATSSQLSCKV